MVGEGDAPRPNNHTPLHWAVKNGHALAAHALLEAVLAQDSYVQLLTGSSIDHPAGPECQTPLHLAVKFKHMDLATMLIRHGAQVNLGVC